MRCHHEILRHVTRLPLRYALTLLRYVTRVQFKLRCLLLLRCELSSAPGNAQLNNETEGRSDKQLRLNRRLTKSRRAEAAAVHTRKEVAMCGCVCCVWVQLFCRYAKKCVRKCVQ